ncbi:hypothetical protein PTKIN_Ptkin07bG0066600 [Pterospermum kingtungense]
MGSLRSWTSDKFEVVDDKQGTDIEIKSVSSHGSSPSSSSSNSSQDVLNDVDDNRPLVKSEQPQLRSPATFRVPIASSTELSSENHMPAAEGYVPNRIPSSVFSGKPATTTDWSTASNESLFSIHIGNGSYSKDQFFMLCKSGELTKFDEQMISQCNPLPPLQELELEDMASRISEVAEDNNSHHKIRPADDVHNPISNTPAVALGEVAANSSQEKTLSEKVYNNPIKSISGCSDESTISTRSFVFPVLTMTSPSDAGGISSVNGGQNNKELQAQPVKQQVQQQEQNQFTGELQPQSPVTPQVASRRSWFSCFYFCHRS